MSENNESFEVDLDLLDESGVEEEIEINPDLNPLEEAAPVLDGVHRCKVLTAESGAWSHKEWKGKDGVVHPFVSCKFSLSVVDEGPDFNRRIFPQAINTIVFDGKNEMAHLLIQILGGTPEAKAEVVGLKNYVALAKAFKAAIASEPIVRVETRWQVQRKTGQVDKKGRDKYTTVLTGMKNFKKRSSGGHDPNLEVKGETLKARAVVTGYLPDGVD